ncbi:MAG: hypothetical protein LBL92_02065 [Propionibacteriaceae bacterium]|nr:hypothetical protein [Propionibacteriaceae bacterium]
MADCSDVSAVCVIVGVDVAGGVDATSVGVIVGVVKDGVVEATGDEDTADGGCDPVDAEGLNDDGWRDTDGEDDGSSDGTTAVAEGEDTVVPVTDMVDGVGTSEADELTETDGSEDAV